MDSQPDEGPQIVSEADALRHVMELGRRLVEELDPDAVIAQVLAGARVITGARHATLRVLSEDDTTSSDPGVSSVLSVPILIEGQTWGNLHLSEKDGGEPFTAADEAAVVGLAAFASTAITNAQRYEQAERGRTELSRAARSLQAAGTISDAIGAGAPLDTILELIVKRGRALADARTVMIMVVEDGDLVLVAGTGDMGQRLGTRIAIAGTFSEQVLANRTPVRIDAVPPNLETARDQLGVMDARAALVIPMIHRGQSVGVLLAFDRGPDRLPFTAADQELMHTFASSAATAVAISHSVESDRVRAAINSTESERRRWARDLHDQTLQSLGGLRILLAGARRRDELDSLRNACAQAVADLEYEIQNLRGIISDLRPSLLDDIGLAAAVEALIARHREAGLPVDLTFDLGQLAADRPLTQDLETTVYRLIQEALTNVVKHAHANSARIQVSAADSQTVTLTVSDDGVGFDTGGATAGFGLGSLRERAYLAGGTISLTSSPAGTAVRAELPVAVAP